MLWALGWGEEVTPGEMCSDSRTLMALNISVTPTSRDAFGTKSPVNTVAS